MKIVISSGHGKHIAGAVGILNEHEEAVRVVDRTAIELRKRGVEVVTFEDTVSTTQDENLQRIVAFHNSQGPHDLDVSIHFNCYDGSAHGTECLYYSDPTLAARVSEAIAGCGFTDRGPKQRQDLYFLANTFERAVLVEVCFVDHEKDAATYTARFDEVCAAIADALGGENEIAPPPDVDVLTGTCSWFGGPEDSGVSPSEGLAFIYDITEENQFLFLPMQPPGTTGLARRLNTAVHYCAMRWDYSEHPKETLLQKTVLVRNPKTGFAVTCTPADWGPHEEQTGRLIDLSPSMMSDLDLETDDEVEVIFPYEKGVA